MAPLNYTVSFLQTYIILGYGNMFLSGLWYAMSRTFPSELIENILMNLMFDQLNPSILFWVQGSPKIADLQAHSASQRDAL